MCVPMIHHVWLKDKKVTNPPSERQTGRDRSGGVKDRAGLIIQTEEVR